MVNLKRITVKLNFLWDTEMDTKEVYITVPKDVTPETVIEKLEEKHNYLCFEDETDIYGTEGRNAQTLLEHTCSENNWSWEEISFDLDLNFN